LGIAAVGRLSLVVKHAVWTKESTSIQTVAELGSSPVSMAQLGTPSQIGAAGISIFMTGINRFYIREQME